MSRETCDPSRLLLPRLTYSLGKKKGTFGERAFFNVFVINFETI